MNPLLRYSLTMQAVMPINLPAWCAALLPGHLFWGYHLEKKQLEIIPPPRKTGFSEILSPLLSDLRFASTVISADDFMRFKYFIQQLRQGQAGHTAFRITDHLGKWRMALLASIRIDLSAPYLYGYFVDLSQLQSDFSIKIPDLAMPQTNPANKAWPSADMPPAAEADVDLPTRLIRLRQEGIKSEPHLFDAVATLVFTPGGESGQWQAEGFLAEPPTPAELSHLVRHLKEAFKADNPGPLIVNNTLMSNQPLDWALFVRNNLISYWIQPLIVRRRAKGAIIFASSTAWCFHPDQAAHLEGAIDSIKPLMADLL